eukprot:COSAG03_NODE_339_length_8835_cov_8.679144_8_plen_36_part_00
MSSSHTMLTSFALGLSHIDWEITIAYWFPHVLTLF